MKFEYGLLYFDIEYHRINTPIKRWYFSVGFPHSSQRECIEEIR